MGAVYKFCVKLDGQKCGLQVVVQGVPGVVSNESPESGLYGKRTASSKSVTEQTRPPNALTGLGKPVLEVLRTCCLAVGESNMREGIWAVKVA